MDHSDILLESGTNELEIIEFSILEDVGPDDPRAVSFGVNVAKVLEIIENPGLSPLSSAPHPCFLGTIPLREMVLPVLDLAVWMGMKRARAPGEVILVTRFNSRTTGFLASGVTQIHRVGWRDVEAPHRVLGGCITGLVRIEDRFVQLVDLEGILFDLDPAPDERQAVRAQAGRPITALLAEDSSIMRQMVSERLAEAGFRVLVTGNGEEALALLRQLAAAEASPEDSGDGLPDVVVTDIEMPRLDGYALTRRIKEDPVLGRLPVILFSSLVTDDLRHKGRAVGADAQISKPEFGRLADVVASLVEKG
jgi:chemotaxis signal transduction protein/CheY-like chemotaxis protein